MTFRFRTLVLPAFLFACAASVSVQAAGLDAALTDLIASVRAGNQAFVTSAQQPVGQLQTGYGSLARVDAQGRILVDIYLDGTVTTDNMTAMIAVAGGSVTGVNPYFQFGTVSAWLPVNAISNLAGGTGARTMTMAAKPAVNVGAVTSQGAKVMRSDVANANGYTGSNITVGVLSDSYDTATNTTIHAAQDIASGDLPTPKFIADNTDVATDEGRAMMQIVYDVAPQSSLCFATAFLGEASFAQNIRSLRTNPSCNADVIVDDVFYLDEPFFSDGQVAQTVNDVATSTLLPGKKVAYFSSAGNYQGGGYNVLGATFSTAPTGIGNINLASTASCGLVSPSTGSTAANIGGGFLDFGGGNYAPTVTLSVGANVSGTLLLQWDDLFYQGKVTTDMNFYLFSSTGACVLAFATNNIASADNGFEDVTAGFGASGGTFTGRMMIGRTSAGTNLATRVRLLALNGWSSTLFNKAQAATFGHSSAANATSVAAYVYTTTAGMPYTPAFENFSSAGPSTIAFDANGNRLSVAETRKKPDIAAPDGVNTTFFFPGEDYEGDGFPNFFGTSAAAPHAAGVAALMLQKGGGPNTLSAAQIKSYMQNAAPARVIPYSTGSAVKGWSIYDGYGLIDAVLSLAKIQ
jgi:hypothetical protein